MNESQVRNLEEKVDNAVLYLRGYIEQTKREIAVERNRLAKLTRHTPPESMSAKPYRLYRKAVAMIEHRETHLKSLEATLEMLTAMMDERLRKDREEAERGRLRNE